MSQRFGLKTEMIAEISNKYQIPLKYFQATFPYYSIAS